MSSSGQPTVSPEDPNFVPPVAFAEPSRLAPGAQTKRRLPPLPVSQAMPFAPALGLLVLWLYWIGASGGFYPRTWYPTALLVLSLLAATAIGRGTLLPRQRAARGAVAAFGLLVALNYASIAWAEAPGSALDAANQLLLYLMVGWIVSLLPWTPRAVGLMLGALAIGAAAFCAVGLIRATSAATLDPFFVQYRYSTPLDYPNATAALAVMALWPALLISSRGTLPWWVRAPFLGVAVFLADFALLPQSRGALLGLVVVAPLMLLTCNDRVRLLTRMALVGGSIAFVVRRTVAVDNAINADRHVAPVLAHAASGMLLCGLLALVAGALISPVEDLALRRLPRRPPALGRRGRRVALAASVLVAAAAAVAVASPLSHLVRTVIRSGRHDSGTGATRLLSASPEERFDYVRVAVKLFEGHPLLGTGAGNFGIHYDALRRFPKHSRYVHDITLRVLSETGIVGLAVFLALLACLIVGLARSARINGGFGAAACAATLSLAAYFLLHSSLDWLDEFPALAAAAFGATMAALTMRPPGRGDAQRVEPYRWPRLARSLPRPVQVGVPVALLAACAVLLGAPYLAQRYVLRATASFLARPEQAYQELALAHDFNPLSTDPLVTEGAIALQLGETPRARSSFERAVREENDWYPRVEVALLDAGAGLRRRALQELQVVARLDVDDPLITQIRGMVAAGRRPSPLEFNQLLTVDSPSSLFQPESIH